MIEKQLSNGQVILFYLKILKGAAGFEQFSLEQKQKEDNKFVNKFKSEKSAFKVIAPIVTNTDQSPLNQTNTNFGFKKLYPEILAHNNFMPNQVPQNQNEIILPNICAKKKSYKKMSDHDLKQVTKPNKSTTGGGGTDLQTLLMLNSVLNMFEKMKTPEANEELPVTVTNIDNSPQGSICGNCDQCMSGGVCYKEQENIPPSTFFKKDLKLVKSFSDNVIFFN